MSGIDFTQCRGIVFDLDGTLIDSYDAIGESLDAALASLGFTATPRDLVRGMVGRGLEILVERALRRAGAADPVGLVPEGVRLFRVRYDAICIERTRLLPGVGETLPVLRGRGYRIAVATNKPSHFARRILDALAVGPHLDAVLGPDLVAHPKPHPGMVHAALEAMGVARPEAVYVGDMEIDVETARAAGVRVIVMPTGSSDRDGLETSGADAIVDSFPALLDLLPGA
jgi:phosphoglycolate phosphatase